MRNFLRTFFKDAAIPPAPLPTYSFKDQTGTHAVPPLPDYPGVKVMWGMTGYGPMFPAVYSSHLSAVAYASRQMIVERTGVIRGAGSTDRMYTHSAENTLVQNMLYVPDATHLFMTETDMILPHDVIPRLLTLDKDIAAGLYFLRGSTQPCLFKKGITAKENPYTHVPVFAFPTDKPFLCDCVGLGCILIKRSVFERLAYPWFDLREGMYGSDMYFATKARDVGIETWVDPSVRCGQIDYVEVSYDDYVKKLKDDPTYAGRGFVIGGGSVE